MKKIMNNQVIVISVIILLALIATFYPIYYSVTAVRVYPKEFDKQMGYKLVYATYNNVISTGENISNNICYVVNSDRKIVDSRVSQSGYSPEEIDFKNLGYMAMHTDYEIKDSVLYHNDIVYNGKNIDEALTALSKSQENNTIFNLVIKEM